MFSEPDPYSNQALRVKIIMDNTDLVLDLLEWIAAAPRSYEQTMDAWKTSCPRLSVWEDAVDAGLVRRQPATTSQWTVSITDEGNAFLLEHRPAAA